MENYVLIRVNDGLGKISEYKTRIVEGEKLKEMVWNQTFTIPLAANSATLFEFVVLDEDYTTEDVCGKGMLKLQNCGVFTKGASQNYNLRLFEEKEDTIAGNLHITTKFV